MNKSTPDVPGESPGGLDARFCEAMNAAPVMIWISGKDELRQWFNKAWLAFTGRTVEQEKGHGWTEGVHRDDYNRCVEIHVSLLEARRPFRMQYRLRRYDGEYRWVDDIGVPRFDPDGTFLGFIGSCTDIHEYKAIETRLRELQETLEQRVDETAFQLEEEIEVRAQTEQHLFESSGQLAALIDGIKDCAIYMLDTEGRVASWNTGAERIKGYAAEEIIGQHFSRFYTEADRQAGIPSRGLRTAAEAGKFEAEGWRLRKDGTRFWASVLIDPIHEQDGTLVGFAKVTRDVTEKRQAEDLLEEAQQRMLQMQKMEAVGQLTGGVAHDFNNLLTVILGNLEIAERSIKEKGERADRVTRAIRSATQGARRAATLTQRLLAFSRRQALDPKPVDLNRLIAGEVDLLACCRFRGHRDRVLMEPEGWHAEKEVQPRVQG